MLSTHSLSPFSIFKTSALVDIEVSGVFSSCPASVINSFCSCILRTYGAIAFLENAATSAKPASRLAAATMSDTLKSVFIDCRSGEAFKNMTAAPDEPLLRQ
ncbi:unknown [Firmicutes bacterium CAG:240]|nr:unknown [Firmicutes bacterium CAG:240]